MADIQSWALPRLQRLLPIDDSSLKEIVDYSVSLSKSDAAEHLKNLLGDSPQAFEFISSFNSRRVESSSSKIPPQEPQDERVPAPGKRAVKKVRTPLHNAGPARQPEGYGNVSGGYQKAVDRDGPSKRQISEALSLTQTPDSLQVPKDNFKGQGGSNASSPAMSRDPSPNMRESSKLPPSAAGKLISDLPNVRSKQVKKSAHQAHSQSHSGTSTPNLSETTVTTSSIADLSAAIASLEMSTNPTIPSSELRKCPCNASTHPLFATAPNCLNCGKIICALEGLQPCSFCGAAILTKDQVNNMIKALKEERGVERMVIHNAGASRSGRGTPTAFGASTPDENISGDEASSAAARARVHRDKLLAFQRDNAQRTRIHDEAADYDVNMTPGTTQWMSPLQRAAALKKQQKYMREIEGANRPEWEKKRTVMSMSIKNGKLVKSFQTEKTSTPDVESEHPEVDLVEDGQSDGQRLSVGGSGGGAFSNNPLLASGKLVRPIWKGHPSEHGIEGNQEGKGSRKSQSSVWRRVQVDSEDNEQWILDGGLHGHGTESRLTEDGNQ